jgi:predicted amidohydrolase
MTSPGLADTEAPRGLAVAQAVSVLRDVDENVRRHVRLSSLAAAHGARLVVFPELSLTSYDLGLTLQDAIDPGDARLAPLAQVSRDRGLTIVAGAPLREVSGGSKDPQPRTPGGSKDPQPRTPGGSKDPQPRTPGGSKDPQPRTNALHIGAVVFHPDGGRHTHTKQYLHVGEDVAFSPGRGGLLLPIGEDQVGLAICADITHPEHAHDAAARGATVYAAGALISESGYAPDTAWLRQYAVEHRMLVLMANYGAPTGGWASAGRSAVWLPDGSLLAVAPPAGEAVVIARSSRSGGSSWEGVVAMGPLSSIPTPA